MESSVEENRNEEILEQDAESTAEADSAKQDERSGTEPEDRNDAPDSEEAEAIDGEFTEAGEESKLKGFFGKKKKDKKDQQIEELTDRVQRQMAEFDNFRKRSEKEKSAMYEIGAKSVVEKILLTVDNFERGFAALTEEQKSDPFVEGMDKVYRQMMTTLEEIGVKPIEAVGKEFDPNFHNAVMHVEDDAVGENIIVEEFQKGYLYRDSVVRHSMVKVAN